MDTSTKDMQEHPEHQYSRPYERAGHKENPDKHEPGHSLVAILDAGHFHHQGSLSVAYSSTTQSETGHLAMHMALLLMAENNIFPLADPAPHHSHMG